MSSTNKQVILIALSAMLVVLFLFMPEAPSSLENKPKEVPVELSVEKQIEEAIQTVKGPAPMQGILKLKSIAEKDPSQIDAQYFLGISSIQIGELEIAVDRFKKVITFAGLKKYPDTRMKLAECLEKLGRKEEAIEQLEMEVKEMNIDNSLAKSKLESLRN